MKSKYVSFKRVYLTNSPICWRIVWKKDKTIRGAIYWDSGWKGYGFESDESWGWNAESLQEIANFIKTQTLRKRQ